MENIKTVKDYLKYRSDRLKKINPEYTEKINLMTEMLENAKENPSENCLKKQHSFVFIATADLENSAIYYFKCEHCNEVVFEDNVVNWR